MLGMTQSTAFGPLKCNCCAQVMSRVPLTLAPTGDPVHLIHARGYLFLTASTGVAVFNTTGYDNRRGPRMVVAHPYSSVASGFAPEGLVSCNLHGFLIVRRHNASMYHLLILAIKVPLWQSDGHNSRCLMHTSSALHADACVRSPCNITPKAYAWQHIWIPKLLHYLTPYQSTDTMRFVAVDSSQGVVSHSSCAGPFGGSQPR